MDKIKWVGKLEVMKRFFVKIFQLFRLAEMIQPDESEWLFTKENGRLLVDE